jgi:lysophospholipase L1-like esterase
MVMRQRPGYVRWGVALLSVLLLLAACAASGGSGGARVSATATPIPRIITSGTPAATVQYVAIGASDAYGTGTTNPATDNWPAVLARTLGPSLQLTNLGIPGATVSLALRDEAPLAAEIQPRLVTVFLGINDLIDGVDTPTFAREFALLLDTLRDETHAILYVANLPDLTLLPYFANRDGSALEQEVLAWNAIIATAATNAGAVLVDLYGGWGELAQNPAYVSKDGLHPSTQGAQRLAAAFAEVIAESGGL